jgi:hypothetical protein
VSAVLSILLLLALPPGGKTPTPGAAPAAAAAMRADTAARSYCAAWKNGDVKAMTSLFAASRRSVQLQDFFGSLARQGAVRCASGPSAARPETTTGDAIVFAIPIAMTSNTAGTTLYVAADGQIAFDPVLVPHPGVVLGRAIRLLTSPDAGQRAAGAAVLANRGVPLEGYSANAEPARRDAAAANIAQWWQSSSGELGTGFPLSPEDLAFASK